jgi:hypothetical protein
MNMKENTYTYTARSAVNPSKVVTFTLHDHRMSVELGAPLELVERALGVEEGETDADQEARIQPWVKPMAVSVMERVARPFNIADVDVNVQDDRLQVTSWVRTTGLRLAPVVFLMEHVDNPEAAHAFAGEVEERKATGRHPGRFRGPLDYWGGWFLVGLAIAVMLWIGLRREDPETA